MQGVGRAHWASLRHRAPVHKGASLCWRGSHLRMGEGHLWQRLDQGLQDR